MPNQLKTNAACLVAMSVIRRDRLLQRLVLLSNEMAGGCLLCVLNVFWLCAFCPQFLACCYFGIFLGPLTDMLTIMTYIINACCTCTKRKSDKIKKGVVREGRIEPQQAML